MYEHYKNLIARMYVYKERGDRLRYWLCFFDSTIQPVSLGRNNIERLRCIYRECTDSEKVKLKTHLYLHSNRAPGQLRFSRYVFCENIPADVVQKGGVLGLPGRARMDQLAGIFWRVIERFLCRCLYSIKEDGDSFSSTEVSFSEIVTRERIR